MFAHDRNALMNSALRHLAWTLPVLALLAGCNGGENAKHEPHAIATYAPATVVDQPCGGLWHS